MNNIQTIDIMFEEPILELLNTAFSEQRSNTRSPFFLPVTITTGDAQQTKLSAFSLEISSEGIGLLHTMPLKTHRCAALSIPTTESHQVELSIEIKWCEPCGEGWYLSGGRFKKLSIEELPSFMY